MQCPGSESDLHDVLSDAVRRRIITILEGNGTEPVHREMLITRLCDAFPQKARATLSLTLHHVHLPTLEANGVVSCDSLTNEITQGTRFAAATRRLTPENV